MIKEGCSVSTYSFSCHWKGREWQAAQCNHGFWWWISRQSQDGNGVRNNYLVDSLLVKTTWPVHPSWIFDNSFRKFMEHSKVPEQLVRKWAAAQQEEMRPWGLHAHKFNCTAGAFCRGINEGVDGPDSVLESSFGVRVGEGLCYLSFAAGNCSGDK